MFFFISLMLVTLIIRHENENLFRFSLTIRSMAFDILQITIVHLDVILINQFRFKSNPIAKVYCSNRTIFPQCISFRHFIS